MGILTLDILWYLVIILALMCYAMLDGFDLGVGALHLFTKKDEERRLFINSIGPLWDGNEVWIVIVIGALFAGFPDVYATLLSGFYDVIMLLLAGLIFRAVAIEFRSKQPSLRWRFAWDRVFSVASMVIAFGIGLILGNLVEGVPLDEAQTYLGVFGDLFRPYPVLVGFTTLTLLAMHGSIYLAMKTEDPLHAKLRPWINRSVIIFICFYLATTIATLLFQHHMVENMKKFQWLFVVPLSSFLAIINIPLQIRKGNNGFAFASSCLAISLLLSLFAIGTYPTLIRSTINPENNSLNIINSASSPLTLKVLLIIVAIGLPLVFAYGFYLYRIFRGKVQLDEHSY
ncbi:MAG: cytochrome d ubiquinol oxidase subunit II [Chlamydiota bacterium]